MTNNRFLAIFFHWLPIGGTVFIAIAFGGLIVHQQYRNNLNDPQVQMVRDATQALESGKQPVEVVGRAPLFDVSQSLAPFIAVYDESGNPLESSASVNQLPPHPPVGLFAEAKKHGEYAVTWQPDAQTRIALVIRPVATQSGWFVLAGRNMVEGEAHEAQLTCLAGIALIVGLVGTFILDAIGDAWRRKTMQQK